MDEPILTSSLILPNRDDILDDPFEIEDLLGNQIDGLINAGIKTTKLTTIVDMTSSRPEVIRQGAADVDSLLL
ncbi:MAG: Sua5/YciO/YrdC/YwlC family protein, partial [Psychrobacter sp.]|jgi:tRNA A37 threonylcarbamoyladenosine synthetase subunit TsaC/SUA5/YrdC